MHPKTCFALMLLCLAAVQGLPAGKIEKKSVSDEATLETSDLKLEEVGDSKDRSKKSTFCVEIRPEGQDGQNKAEMQIPSVQTLNLVPQAQMVPQAQLVPQVQTYNLQPAMQPMQTLSVMQAPQQVAQQSILVPQQMVPSVQTLQIIQPPQQPCPETKVNIIEQKAQIVPETTPAPAPPTTTQPAPIEKPEPPRPSKYIAPQLEELETVVNVVQQPDVVDTVNIMPLAPVCKEQIVVLPPKPVVVVPEPQRLPTVVQIPHCHHHSSQALIGQCNCRTQGYAAVRSAGLRADPMHLMGMRARAMDDGHVHMVGRHEHLY